MGVRGRSNVGGMWGRNKKNECESKVGEDFGNKVGKEECGRKVKEESVDS